jgi:hypothetical protein
MVAERENRGILVSSGRFTNEARDFASGKPIELMDGELLNLLIPSGAKVTERNLEPTWKASSANPGPCPGCGSEFVRRVAKRGITREILFGDVRCIQSAKARDPSNSGIPEFCGPLGGPSNEN